jgi:hypothetical protein
MDAYTEADIDVNRVIVLMHDDCDPVVVLSRRRSRHQAQRQPQKKNAGGEKELRRVPRRWQRDGPHQRILKQGRFLRQQAVFSR